MRLRWGVPAPRVLAYLRLCRAPNVFTSFSDVLAGVFIARSGGFHVRDLALVAASACLYSAGMALNDFFDRRLDAVERPERPIPSGAIPAKGAAAFGFGLLALGLLATLAAGPRSWIVGATLAASILLYDALAKATVFGPIVMGACRLLNVTLGLSAVDGSATLSALPAAALLLPAGLGLYTAVLTSLARAEVDTVAPRRHAAVVAAIGTLAVLYVVLLAATATAGLEAPALVFYAYLLVRGARVFAPVVAVAAAAAVRRAIGGGILLMPAIDAAAVASLGHLLPAVIVLAAAAPAHLLRRRFAMS
jgi:4-hydroxybenzoate polyprenyltransferase